MANTLVFLILVIISSCNAHLQKNPRIVGGTIAAENAAPYIVSIQLSNVHDCGGSILNEHWVLTAGHCVLEPGIIKKLLLVAGSNDVSSTEATVQRRKIDSYKIHPKYTGGAKPYDIALLYTAEPFHWSPKVKPVKLPKQDYEALGLAELYGWGSISKDSNVYPQQLRQAKNLPILNYEECRKALTGILESDPTILDKTNLCTGPLNRGIQACTADSGGPLVQVGGDTVLVGVVSWGPIPCGSAPSVFVKVADFLDWIEEQQKQHLV